MSFQEGATLSAEPPLHLITPRARVSIAISVGMLPDVDNPIFPRFLMHRQELLTDTQELKVDLEKGEPGEGGKGEGGGGGELARSTNTATQNS